MCIKGYIGMQEKDTPLCVWFEEHKGVGSEHICVYIEKRKKNYFTYKLC